MKNKNFFQSLKCAAKGLITAFKAEPKFKIYLLHFLVAFILNLFFKVTFSQHLICFLTVIGVFSAECFNLVIERACDMYTTEYNENIKFIKDVSAAGVFCWGIAFYSIELIYFVKFLLNVLLF